MFTANKFAKIVKKDWKNLLVGAFRIIQTDTFSVNVNIRKNVTFLNSRR